VGISKPAEVIPTLGPASFPGLALALVTVTFFVADGVPRNRSDREARKSMLKAPHVVLLLHSGKNTVLKLSTNSLDLGTISCLPF